VEASVRAEVEALLCNLQQLLIGISIMQVGRGVFGLPQRCCQAVGTLAVANLADAAAAHWHQHHAGGRDAEDGEEDQGLVRLFLGSCG
jgi:hypothetical protein